MLKNAFWLFVLAAIIFLVFLPSYTQMMGLVDKNRAYQKQTKFLIKQNAELKRELKMLKEDPVYLEKVARERMGLAREGEVIYKMGPGTPSQQLNKTRK